MNTKELISKLKEKEMDEKLLDIYLDSSKLDYQRDRYIKAIERYIEIYGTKDAAGSETDTNSDSDINIEIYSAPGRTEVGGNHTDHQHGQVLAASINNDVIAVVSKNDSDTINILSEGYDMITIQLSDITKKDEEKGTTLSLIKGVIAGAKEREFKAGGFDAYITSDVLGGSGLSSSAAFETIIGNIISGLYNDMKIDAVTIAIIGQYAENVYFGKPCGLMDQMACSVGSLCHIDFHDPAKPVIERIEADFDKAGYSLCITDTKGSHANLTPDYAAIPGEMKSVAKHFGKEVLIEVPESEVIANITELREKLGDRAVLRALHFYGENERVEEEVAALKANDFTDFLSVVRASGNSSYKFLQNVYTNHDIEHQNVSIALCISEKVLGNDGGVARVHGGGFAGTIQAFVRNEKVAEYKAALDKVFGEDACSVLKIRKYGGIKVI